MDKLNVQKSVVRSKDAVSRVIDGETVLLTPENSTVHVLNDVGTKIWSLTEKPITIQSIVGEIIEEYDVSPEVLHKDVKSFINELISKGVLKELVPTEMEGSEL